LLTYSATVDAVFRAIDDPSRRLLMDRLFDHDGQTLGELCGHLPHMTRFGVMNHLRVLEEAGLVVTRKVGRNKHHYLNPVPIRMIHERWIAKYAEPTLDRLSDIRGRAEDRYDSQTENKEEITS
jgi:DNA-binding transcriptional ArsR family regulator